MAERKVSSIHSQHKTLSEYNLGGGTGAEALGARYVFFGGPSWNDFDGAFGIFISLSRNASEQLSATEQGLSFMAFFGSFAPLLFLEFKTFPSGPEETSLGACAMTTKCLDNKICTFKNFIVVAFPTKNSVFGRFSSLPPFLSAPPLKSENCILLSSRQKRRLGVARQKIAARQFLSLDCLAIALTARVTSREALKPSLVGERQCGRHFRREFG